VKYTVPFAAEISSPVTPEGTSVCATAPVATFNRTSAPALVTARIPGSVPVCEAAGTVADGCFATALAFSVLAVGAADDEPPPRREHADSALQATAIDALRQMRDKSLIVMADTLGRPGDRHEGGWKNVTHAAL
jgi:hypothetical protein